MNRDGRTHPFLMRFAEPLHANVSMDTEPAERRSDVSDTRTDVARVAAMRRSETRHTAVDRETTDDD